MIKIPRLEVPYRWMMMAHLVATNSTCNRGPELFLCPGRHGVGAVIVKNKRPIAMGYNGSPPGFDHCNSDNHIMSDGHCVATIHAEANALLQCALDETSPRGGDLYVTASPCWDCANDLIRVGIKSVIIGSAYNSRYGLSSQVEDRLHRAGIYITCVPDEEMKNALV